MPDRAVRVPDRQLDRHLLAALERRRARARAASCRAPSASSSSRLCFCSVADRVGHVGLVEQLREVEPLRLPVRTRAVASRAARRGRSSRRRVRKPSFAMYSRSFLGHEAAGSASTCSGRPAKRLRSSGSCVAMPTGQVFRWQTRIRMQPSATSGAVEKPNSSAPSSAAITTSRPVLRPPSVCTRMRPRRSFSTSVCCVSASPISHGTPAYLIDASGEAPVPPSWPADQHAVGLALRDARGDRADAGLRRRASR